MANKIEDSLAIEELHCTICKELYKSPVDLPCGHTFCLECIRNWSAIDEHMSCPLCRQQSIIGGVESLPKNEFIECLVDLKLNKCDDHCQICCHCEKCCICEIRCVGEISRIAKWRCLQCQQNICDDDCKRHKRQFTTKGHKIIKMIDFMQCKDNSICEKPDRCRKHPELDVSLYCTDCRDVLCVNCLVEKHKTHRFDKLEDKVNERKELILKDVGKVIDATSCACDENLRKLQDEKELILETVSTIENSVNKHFQENLKILERFREELCCKLKNLKELKFKKIAQNKQELESCLTELNGVRKGVDKLIDQSSFSDLVCNPPPFLHTTSETLQEISNRNVLNSDIFLGITLSKPNVDFLKLLTDHNVFGDVEEVDQTNTHFEIVHPAVASQIRTRNKQMDISENEESLISLREADSESPKKNEHKIRREEFDKCTDQLIAKFAGPKVDAKECLQFQTTLQDNLVISENNSNPQGVILENTKQTETSSTFLIKHNNNIDVIEAGLQVCVGQTKANIVWLKAEKMCIVTGSENEVEKVGKIFMECFRDCLHFPDSESNQKYRKESNPIKENVSETSSTFLIKHDVDMNIVERGLQVAVGQTKVDITWCKEDRMCVVTGSLNEVQKVEKIFKESFGDCLLQVRGSDSKPYKANAGSKNQTITIEQTRSQANPTTPNPNLKSIPMPVIPFVITIDTRAKLEFKSTDMNLTVHVYKSDIVKQITDIIVNSADCYLMNKDKLPRAILKSAGPGVEKECQNLRTQYGSIPPGGSTFTSAGNLRPMIQHIIHAIGPDHEHAMRNKQQAHKCLLEMYKHCLFVTIPLIPTNNRTISFPPVGSKLIGTTDAVRAAFEAIQSFTEHWSKLPRRQRTTLTDIHFVSIDQTEIEDSIVTFRSLIAV